MDIIAEHESRIKAELEEEKVQLNAELEKGIDWVPMPLLSDTDDQARPIKQRKKRLPVKRDRSEELLIIDALLEKYGIEYADQMRAIAAWGFIVSGEFTHEFIKEVVICGRQHLILNDERKLYKPDFLERYRKRFTK